MRIASTAASICSESRVTGVVFFDYKRGQTGIAPNAIELHSVLNFGCPPSVTPASAFFDSPVDG